MKEINDQQLDMLIQESIKRQHVLDEIGHQIMRDIKAEARRQRLRYWLRLLFFCFGQPAILMAIAGGTYCIVGQMGHWFEILPLLVSALFALSAIIWQLNKKRSEYSWK